MSDAPKPADHRTAAPRPIVPVSRYVMFAGVAAAGLALDLASKSWVFGLPGGYGHVHWLVPGYVGLQTSLNEGALFGMGQGKVGLFAVVSIGAAVAIPLWLFVWRAARDAWLTLILAGVLGGVLGNLYDRLGLSGLRWGPPDPRAGETVYAVRDWILLQASDTWRWPNFNIADSLLVVGAAALFLRAWLEPGEEHAADEEESDASTEARSLDPAS